MDLNEFSIGLEFWMSNSQWRCTDVGTRTVIAIKIDKLDHSWYKGPPYAVAEHVLDEYALEVCSLIKDKNNE
jgi:hypothetical protein